MPAVVEKAFLQKLAETGGACGTLIASHDWRATALADAAAWTPALRTSLSIVLRSPVPMVLLWGPEGLCLYNDAFSILVGDRHPDLLGASVRDAGLDALGLDAETMAGVLGGKALTDHARELTFRRDGAVRQVFVDLGCSPVAGEDEAPAGILCVVTDVTDRVLAERQRDAAETVLKDSEAEFRLMVDTVPQIIWIADANGQMEFLSRQFSEYTGAGFRSMSPGEIAGAFIHSDDAPHVVAAFQKARDNDEAHFSEHRILSAAGEYRWFLDRAHSYRDRHTGEVTRWFGASVDIHDRRLAEEGLRELNANLEERVAERTAERNLLGAIVEHTDVMVMAVDLDYNILAINAANADEFERVFGLRPKAGDNILAHLADRPEQQAEVRAGWARGLGGEPVTFIEEFGDPERARPYYEVTFRPLHDAEGALIGCYQFVTDVTDRLRREAELIEAQSALRQSQKLEAIGQLTGGVAHDFNNLLMAILGNLELLRKHLPADPRTARLIDGAVLGAQRGTALTQRLLAFARRQDLSVEPRDLSEIVNGMVDLLEQSIGSGIELAISHPAEAPIALVDANQMELAILNLAVNARDAMPNGGQLTLEIDHAAGDGDLVPGDYVRVVMTDTGQGMDDETLKKATEPFFSTKGVGKGTGLGLSMIHGLASQLQGTLRLSSVVGEGTRAELWLPRASRDAAPIVVAAAEPIIVEPGELPPARILVVDDDMLVSMSTVDMLRDLGHDVLEAASGAEALEILAQDGPFDLMITDYAMPRMNGAELARAARGSYPRLPILLATGNAEMPADERLDLPRLGKPYNQSQLATQLHRLLRG
ncbi:PAS domain-containing hybrid sensor histidine kinase/response regulator [Aureimonas phyllosphaerae]|uniref:histidine kinase n=1 Tax=Aureimonas phyllosphaerae TaxID=1166078 RepID=A0A7W6FSJ6_9HYPH|nr:PAS domain S-box protein [Aureimonas phyllosphaerae]MBB3934229.1 PAS domain S-box-containing protein [Aureimonas phyllosphaerae]MBB3958555.1 PAS domain S-box-containing protein [Aureimonas phyllosphaerae]SFE98781.1 PAS domain S-box-containing protein [Aureimonas phyllosphaerae]